MSSRHRCAGWGKTATRPLESGLRHFEREFREHVEGHCRALVCSDLIHFEIVTDKCRGERCCLQSCPGNAIKGAFGKPGRIVERLCTKCWICTIACPYGAVHAVSN
ncbi:MAG: 4Fe-4S binding protein [Coriobacteriia bacterium]